MQVVPQRRITQRLMPAFFENNLWVPELLHVSSNGVEHALCGLAIWTFFLHKLKSIERFWQYDGLRKVVVPFVSRRSLRCIVGVEKLQL